MANTGLQPCTLSENAERRAAAFACPRRMRPLSKLGKVSVEATAFNVRVLKRQPVSGQQCATKAVG
jgi:hypothetical protein